MLRDSKLPRPGTIIYDLIYGTIEQKKKAFRKFRIINSYLIIPLYRIGILPLLGFSRIFLLLITFGRKSGKKYITPLEYHRIDSIIHIFSSRGERTDWLKNLRKNPDKTSVKLGFRTFRPRVEIMDDPKEKLEIIKWYVGKHPYMAKELFGWDCKTDDPESGILDPIADLIPIVKLHEMHSR